MQLCFRILIATYKSREEQKGLSAPSYMPGRNNPWPILESLPVAARAGKRGRWEKGLAESLARPDIVAPTGRPENPRHIYQHLSP